MGKEQGSISNRHRSLGDLLSEVFIQAPVAAIERARGKSELDANYRAVQVANNVDEITGIRQGPRSAEAVIRGKSNKSDYVNAGLLAATAVAGGKGLLSRPASAEAAPVVRNSLYGGTPFKPVMHTPQTANVPRYAFRNVNNPGEINDLLSSGYMRPAKPNGQKYFSVSNDPLGNPSNLTDGRTVLRVDTRYIPNNSPVSSRHVEIWDHSKGQFVGINRRR